MSTLLTDDALARLLQSLGEQYEVPADGAVKAQAAGRPHPLRTASRRWLQVAAVAAGILLVAAAVWSGGPGSSAKSGTSSFVGNSSSAGGSAVAPSDKTAPGAAPLTAGVPDAAPAAPRSGAGTVAPATDAARIVKTGSIALVAADGTVGAVLDQLPRVAAGAHGYLAASNTEEAGRSPSGTITMRIPAGSYELVVQRVRALGAKVVSLTSNGQDVTATYADVEAQIASLTAARARFLVILGQAKTIGETLAVQQRVDDVQGQIDRLQGQRRVLADQSDFATLTVTVSQAGSAAIEATQRSGLSAAWHDAVTGFTGGIEAILARSGLGLVVLLFLGLLGLAARVVWRIARRAAL